LHPSGRGGENPAPSQRLAAHDNPMQQSHAVHSRVRHGVAAGGGVMLNINDGATHVENGNGGALRDAEGLMRLGLRQRARLYEISRAFSELVDLDQLLPSVIARTNALFAVESSAIMLLDAATNELFVPYIADVAPEVERRFATVRFPADQGIAGWVLQHGAVEAVNDVHQDPRWYRSVDGHTGMTTRSLLCAPLRTRDGAIGVIALRNKLRGAFDAEDTELIGALAETIAIAIDNARRFGDAQRSAERLRDTVDALQQQVARDSRFAEIVGHSPGMQAVFRLLASAAASPVTVLISGETGTGKELVARAVHYNSARCAAPFVAVNCGALSETLLQSELFGHRKGAFTGALTDKKGLFEVADGGTIFLDEIGDMPLPMQVKLLRVLQEGEFLPVGDTVPRRVDVRVISATHHDLAQETATGAFRADLYYRLSAFPIVLPPLRERREDIPLLVAQVLERTCAKFARPVSNCSARALELLTAYAWPGNVRELQNEIERAVALAPVGGAIEPVDLSERIARAAAPRVALPSSDLSLRRARELFEREYVAHVLAQHGGNASRAAKVLGISRVMLQRKIRLYGLREKGASIAPA
jgi:Nif-specific regulatory protein